jgi:hypothetical protein
MKTRPLGAELFHADGRTDMTNPKTAFRNFMNAPKNGRRSRRVKSENKVPYFIATKQLWTFFNLLKMKIKINLYKINNREGDYVKK